jgi:hypothetical protein
MTINQQTDQSDPSISGVQEAARRFSSLLNEVIVHFQESWPAIPGQKDGLSGNV